MSVVGKELAESSAGRNSDSEGFAGELSKLLKMKEEEGSGIAEKKKKDNNEGGDIKKIHKMVAHADGFDSDLFLRTLEELVEKRKKKTDDPPPGDERNHIKSMRLLKEMHEKVKMEKKDDVPATQLLATRWPCPKMSKSSMKKDDVPATQLLASRAPCTKMSKSSMKWRNKASLKEFRKQIGPHRTTAWNMFLEDVAWSRDDIDLA